MKFWIKMELQQSESERFDVFFHVIFGLVDLERIV